LGIETQLPDKFVPIHLRHENISDDQVRLLFSYDLQRLRAAFRFDQPVTSMGEYGDENASIVGAVIDNENSFHKPDIVAASMQPSGAESTYFDFVKSRKSRPSTTDFGPRTCPAVTINPSDDFYGCRLRQRPGKTRRGSFYFKARFVLFAENSTLPARSHALLAGGNAFTARQCYCGSRSEPARQPSPGRACA
jgi:hypothetical protein